MVTVKQALVNQFSLFPISFSFPHWWTVTVGKRGLTFGFIDHLGYGKKRHSEIPVTTTGIEGGALTITGRQRPLWSECELIGYGHLYPAVQFDLLCTINSHQADTVNGWDWGKDSSCIKRTTPEQMGCCALLTKPKAFDQTPSRWPVQRGFPRGKKASKSRLAYIQASNYSASGKASPPPPSSLTLFEKIQQAKQEMCFHFQRQPRAKIERHFNELSQWGATCFIQIIGWLATLKQPLLGKQSFLSF